jgi:O-antigen ligase
VNQLALLLLMLLLAVAFFPAILARPARTIFPIYAGTLPIASVIKLGVPLPPPFNTLSSLLGFMAIAFSAGHIMVSRRGRVPGLPDAIWMLFLGWAGLTAAWAIKPPDVLQAFLVAAPLILLMVVASLLAVDGTDLDAISIAVILGGIVIGLYALALLVSGKALPTHGVSQRFSLVTNSQDTNPNILAASLLLPMVVSVERILMGGSRWLTSRGWHLLGVTGAFFSFFAIVFTGSRGGVLSAVVAFGLCLLLSRQLPQARLIVRRIVVAVLTAILAGAAGVLLALTISPQGTAKQILSTSALQRLTNTQGGGSGRLEIWTAGYRACILHCGAGAGLGNFPNAYDQTFAFSGVGKNVGQSRPAHDIYLSLAVETGIVGLSLFLLALMAEWRGITRSPALLSHSSLKAGLAGILVANVFLSAIWFKYFWLVFVYARVASGAAAAGEGSAPLDTLPYERIPARALT